MKLNKTIVRVCGHCGVTFSFKYSFKRSTPWCSDECKKAAIKQSKVRKLGVGEKTYLTKKERKRKNWIEKRKKDAGAIGKCVRSEEFIESNDFYKSREWRELRAKVLMTMPHRCNLCNRSKTKDNITLHVDHILPKSLYPKLALNIENLQILCEDCNIGKSNYVYS